MNEPKLLFVPAYFDDFGWSPDEFRLLARIYRRCWPDKSGAWGICYEGVPGLSRSLLMSEAVVRTTLKILERAKAISNEERPGRSSIIRVEIPSKWISSDELPALRTLVKNERGSKTDRAVKSDKGVLSETIGEPLSETIDKGIPRSISKKDSPSLAKKASRLPDKFMLTADLRAYAAEKRPGVDVTLETEKFCNYWRAKPGKDGTKLDWGATWKNWILNARDSHRAEQAKDDDSQRCEKCRENMGWVRGSLESWPCKDCRPQAYKAWAKERGK